MRFYFVVVIVVVVVVVGNVVRSLSILVVPFLSISLSRGSAELLLIKTKENAVTRIDGIIRNYNPLCEAGR